MYDEALRRRLNGEKDSRSSQGILSRGKNVYNSGTAAATTGPLNPVAPVGNPEERRKKAIQRRLQQGKNRNMR